MPTPKKIIRSLASRLPGSASLRRRITRAGLRRPRHTPSKSRNESFVGEDENAPTPSRFPEFAPNKKKTKTGSPSTEGDSDNGSGAISNDSPGGSDGIDDNQICPVRIDFGGRDTESSGGNDIILEDSGIENGMMDNEGGASIAFDDDDAIDSDANQPCPMHVDAAQLEENDSTQEDESNLDMLVDDESGASADVDSLVHVTKRTWKVNESVYYQLIEKENEEEENVERVGAGAGAKSKAKITWIEASIRDIVEIPHYALVLVVDDDDYVPTEGLKSPVSGDDEVTVGAADIARLVKRRDEVSCNLDPRQKHNRRLRRYHYRRGTKEAYSERSGAKLEYVSTSDALAANVQHAEENMTEACKLMRDGDGKKCPGLVTMIMNLMTMPHIKQMIRKATDGKEGATFENVLMWLIGQELGIEIQESFRGGVTEDGWFLDALKAGEESNARQLGQFGTNRTKILFWSVASVRLKSSREVSNESVIVRKWMNNFEDDDDLFYRKHSGKILEALKLIAGLQYRHQQYAGPAGQAVITGMRLLLDKSGTSTELLDNLARRGIVGQTQLLRKLIRKAASLIASSDVRSPAPPGFEHMLAETFDNADIQHFGSTRSGIACSTVSVRHVPIEDVNHLNDNFLSGFPQYSDMEVDDILPTKEIDEKHTKPFLANQNALALLTAYIDFEADYLNGAAQPDAESPDLDIFDTVWFTVRGREKQGRIDDLAYTGDEEAGEEKECIAAVSYYEDGEHQPTIVQRNLSELKAEPTDSGPSSSAVDAADATAADGGGGRNRRTVVDGINMDDFRQYEKSYVVGVDDGGGRHKTHPTTTLVHKLLTDVSSKHSESQQQVHNSYLEHYGGEEAFDETVHVRVADQEFIRDEFRQFFTHLHTVKPMPTIPTVALTHLNKNVCVSLLSYYEALFDELFEAQGIQLHSPAYNKCRKGREIRVTVREVGTAIEATRTTAAHRYLTLKGKLLRLYDPDEDEPVSPFAVLNRYFRHSPDQDEGWTKLRTVVPLDANLRPQPIFVSEALMAVVADFEEWLRVECTNGPSASITFHPSGRVEVHDPDLLGTNHVQQPNPYVEAADNDPIKMIVGQLPFSGGMDNIYDHAKRAGLVDPEFSRTDDLYRGRYYLYRKAIAAGFSEEEARAEAFTWKGSGKKRKLPNDVDLNGELFWRFLMGNDSFVVLAGVRLSRMSNDGICDDYENECESCGMNGHICQCKHNFSKNFLLAYLVAVAVNVHTRPMVHYQGILVYQLMHAAMTLKHGDSKSARMILTAIGDVFACSETSDSYKCEPLDGLQEGAAIGVVKGGNRNANAADAWECRSVVNSARYLWGVETKAKDYELGELPPTRPSQKKKETKKFQQMAALVSARLTQLLDRDYSNTAVLFDALEREYSCPVRFYLGPLNGLENLRSHFESMLRGYRTDGCETCRPVQPSKPLGKIHSRATSSASSAQKAEAAQKREQAKRRMEDRREIAKQTGTITVPSSAGMIHAVDHATATKKENCMLTQTLSLLGTNDECHYRSGIDLGHGASRPISLSKSEDAALVERNSRRTNSSLGPTIIFVDLLQELQYIQGGVTYIDWTRNLLRHIVSKYIANAPDEPSLVIMLLDVYTTKSPLQRHKVERYAASVKRTFVSGDANSALGRLRQVNDFVPPNYATLAKSRQEYYLPDMAKEIMEQLLTSEGAKWNPRQNLLPSGCKCTLGFIGGQSNEATAFLLPGRRVSLSSDVSIPKNRLETIVKTATSASEAASMMHHCIHAILSECFDSSSNPNRANALFHLHCRDIDQALALSSYMVYSLEGDIARDRRFTGSILIRAKKTIQQVMNISTRFRSSLGFDEKTVPTGRGFVVDVDPIAIHHRLKGIDSLNFLEDHRMVALCAAGHALVVNDVMKMANTTLRDYIDSLVTIGKSNVASHYDEGACSPVKIHPMAFTLINPPVPWLSLNLAGCVHLLSMISFRRKDIMNFLVRKYSPGQLKCLPTLLNSTDDAPGPGEESNDQQQPGYWPDFIICAAGILSGSSSIVPDPLCKTISLGVFNEVFRHIVAHPYRVHSRPKLTEESPLRFIDNEFKVESSLFTVAKKLKKGTHRSGSPNESVRQLLVDGWLGDLFESNQFGGNRPWTFDPLAICSLAIENKGFLPSVKVALRHVQDEFIAKDMNDFNNLILRFAPFLNSDDAEERQYAVTCIHEIAEKTICTHTDFNEKGNGSPLLCSNTPIVASAGKKGAQYTDLRNLSWDGHDELANMAFKDVFLRLSSRDQSKNVVDLLSLFCTHMFNRKEASNGNTFAIENNIVPDNEEEDGDEEDDGDDYVECFDAEDSDSESANSELDDDDGTDDDNSCAASIPNITEDFLQDEDDVGPIPGLG